MLCRYRLNNRLEFEDKIILECLYIFNFSTSRLIYLIKHRYSTYTYLQSYSILTPTKDYLQSNIFHPFIDYLSKLHCEHLKFYKRPYHSSNISFATPVKNMFKFHDFLSLKDKENHLLLKEAAVVQIIHMYLEYNMFSSSCSNERTKYVLYLKHAPNKPESFHQYLFLQADQGCSSASHQNQRQQH